MVMKCNARRLKCSSACTSHTQTPCSFNSNRRSSTSDFKYTSISLPGCFGLGISTGIIINFRFIHNQGGRLYIQSVTGQILWPLLCSPKGFMPSVLKPNLIFLTSFAKFGNVLSTFLYCDPSAGCLNILSCLCSSLCHRINLAFVLFMNKRFRRGIRGKYHITLAGTLFLTRIPSTSPGSSRGILYRHALHTGHESKFSYSPRYRMQSLG